MNMKCKADKGLMDGIYTLTLFYEDGTKIKLKSIRDFDFDVYNKDISTLEFTADEVSKYMFNRMTLMNGFKNCIKKIEAVSKIYTVESKGIFTERECIMTFKGKLKVKNYRLYSLGIDECCSMQIRMEGFIE